jgi:hypothetical protein
MQAGSVKISKISEAITTDPRGVVSREVVIQFTVGDFGPFTERFAANPFDPAAANLRLSQFAGSLNQLNSAT